MNQDQQKINTSEVPGGEAENNASEMGVPVEIRLPEKSPAPPELGIDDRRVDKKLEALYEGSEGTKNEVPQNQAELEIKLQRHYEDMDKSIRGHMNLGDVDIKNPVDLGKIDEGMRWLRKETVERINKSK